MAIVFLEKTKRQEYLIYAFSILILIAVFILWKGYFAKEKIPEEIILRPVRKIEIDFEILENPLLKELQPIEKIIPLEAEVKIGRENPFEPY